MIKFIMKVLQQVGRRYRDVVWVAERVAHFPIQVAGGAVPTFLVAWASDHAGDKHAVVETKDGHTYLIVDGKAYRCED